MINEVSVGVWKNEIGLANLSTHPVSIRVTDGEKFGPEEIVVMLNGRSYATLSRANPNIETDHGLLEEHGTN